MKTFQNPVYPHAAPDPFILKYCGEYWCYFTGLQPDGDCFGILHSTDLLDWQPLGSAMPRLPAGSLPYADPCYWAPEVTYDNGKFYMYYSVGDGENMQIRVALAHQPTGPFVDAGVRLTTEIFAIDAHVFRDDDGAHYLFYTRDELSHTRIGTGTVQDRLLTPFQLAGQPRPVSLPLYDWQIFDPHRAEKGGVCWHTLEASFVLKHTGRYYQMFSGGNWQNASYGVAYAVTEDLNGPGEWRQPVDGLERLPLLRSLPELGVIGPGHNSVVRGLDNRELFCAYHRWQVESGERVLAIDRLGWQGDDLWIDGPSSQPQPAPHLPRLAGFAELRVSNGQWQCSRESAACAQGFSSADLPLEGTEWLLEVSLRCLGEKPHGKVGLILSNGHPLLLVLIDPENRQLQILGSAEETWLELDPDFDPCAFHLLRVEFGPRGVQISLDERTWNGGLFSPPSQLQFIAYSGDLELRGLALT